MRERLTNSSGSTIGYLDDQGSRIYLYSSSLTKLGYYDKNSNTTYNASGSSIGKGNLLTMLLNK